jgi:hypothetical protein
MPGPKETLISLSSSELVAAPTAGTFYVKRRYPVPAGRVCRPIRAGSTTPTAGSRTTIGIGRKLGSFAFNATPSLGVLTLDPTDPTKHYARLFAVVTTILGGTGAPSLIATYKNEAGVAGRLSVASVIPISSPVGNAFELPLQIIASHRDGGILDLTSLADTVGNNGASAAVDIIGLNILHDAGGVLNGAEGVDFPMGTPEARPPEEIFILLQQVATTAQQRAALFVGALSLGGDPVYDV